MSTVGDVVQELVSEFLNRGEDIVEPATKQCWKAYQMIVLKVPFDDLREKSDELAIATSTNVLDVSALNIAGISWVRVTSPDGQKRLIDKLTVRHFDGIQDQESTGGPTAWARWNANQIEFDQYSTTSGWTAMLRYWRRPIAASDGIAATELEMPSEWEDLLFFETLYRVALLMKDYDLATNLITPMPMPRQPSPTKTRTFEIGIIPKLWNDLLRTVEDRESLTSNLATRPMIRPMG